VPFDFLQMIPEGDWFCPSCRPKEILPRTPRKSFTEFSSIEDSESDEEVTQESMWVYCSHSQWLALHTTTRHWWSCVWFVQCEHKCTAWCYRPEQSPDFVFKVQSFLDLAFAILFFMVLALCSVDPVFQIFCLFYRTFGTSVVCCLFLLTPHVFLFATAAKWLTRCFCILSKHKWHQIVCC